ncbi:NAD(P)-binding protein, partial [Neoconidiobolus thromboides FSU 785]
MILTIINNLLLLLVYSLLLLIILVFIINKYIQHQKIQKRKKITFINEKVVIIGASEGVGKELAIKYTTRGADLILVARNKVNLNNLKSELISIKKRDSQLIKIISCDISDTKQCIHLVEKVSEDWDFVDTLIFNAGILSSSFFQDIIIENNNDFSPEKTMSNLQPLDSILDINYRSYILLTGLFINLVQNSIMGTILINSSLGGVLPAPTRSFYCGSKFALMGFFNSLKLEVNDIQVGILCSGSINTGLREKAVDVKLTKNKPKNRGLSAAVVAEKMILMSDNCMDLVFLPKIYNYLIPLYHL